MLDFCFDSDSMFPKMSVFLVLSSNFDKNYLLSVGFNFIFVSQNQKQIVMQNKKRLYKHLIIIYILYFIVLVAGFMLKTIPNFTSGFDAGMALAERELDQGDTHSYYLAADVRNSSGYIEVEGLPENVTVYHAGDKLTEDGTLVTSGGRVLGVTAAGETLQDALRDAYAAAERIQFEGKYMRHDIGERALRALEG